VQTSIVKFEHHSRAYLEGLTKFWGFWGSSVPPYSPFCTLKTHTFDPIPLDNLSRCAVQDGAAGLENCFSSNWMASGFGKGKYTI
jgi:hypothetical protein